MRTKFRQQNKLRLKNKEKMYVEQITITDGIKN
jgi:hypothetical protein